MPENYNSYIVWPTTISLSGGETDITITVTILDDTVDEGFYETFRIKVKSASTTNQPSSKATSSGILVVIVDDDYGMRYLSKHNFNYTCVRGVNCTIIGFTFKLLLINIDDKALMQTEIYV